MFSGVLVKLKDVPYMMWATFFSLLSYHAKEKTHRQELFTKLRGTSSPSQWFECVPWQPTFDAHDIFWFDHKKQKTKKRTWQSKSGRKSKTSTHPFSFPCLACPPHLLFCGLNPQALTLTLTLTTLTQRYSKRNELIFEGALKPHPTNPPLDPFFPPLDSFFPPFDPFFY